MTTADVVHKLAAELSERYLELAADERLIVGIAGIPGAGKSTISSHIVGEVNKRFEGKEPAIVVPMDGFHYSNERLKSIGLLELKGVPESFDAPGFVNLLKELRERTTDNIPAPLFDRGIEASINGGIVIKPENRVCVVEGNYLLLEKSPWNELRQYFDEIWFLDVSLETVYPRLVARHLLQRSPEEAKVKIESTDVPNARLILETKVRADRLIEFDKAD